MQSSLVQVLKGRMVSRPPIWLMRQAGRYLPEYRELRSQASGFLELCYTPDLAVEITLQPIRRYGMDGAIVFSDILVVADALGCAVEFVEGEGPRLSPVRSEAAVARLSSASLHQYLAPVYETLRRLRADLSGETALIGFAGAPWTVVAYMVEGGGSKEFYQARTFARREPEAFAALIDLVTTATIDYLRAQIDAGADVVQLFDSWAGVLPEPEFLRWSLEPMARIGAALKTSHPETPIIAFPRGTGVLYRRFADVASIDGLSLDTTMPLSWAREALGRCCLQGNLDPIALLTGGDTMRSEAKRIVDALAGQRFIFNLGHGVLPETDPNAVADLVDFVRAMELPTDGGSHGS